MLIHARLADRHYIHSTANAVLFRETPSVRPCSTLPEIKHKGVLLGQNAPRPKGRVIIATRGRRVRHMVR